MTIEQYIRDYLSKRMLFDNDIDKIIAIMKQDPANEPMKDRWNDSVDGYPAAIIQLAVFSAKNAALQWMDSECPKHFARLMFE